MLKLQYCGHLMLRADSLEKTLMLRKIEGKRRRGQQRIRWLDSITDSMNVDLSELQKIVKAKKAWSAAVSGIAKSHVQLFVSPWSFTHQASLSLLSPRAYSNSCPSSR